MERFYTTFPQIEDQTFDGMILTGAPVEMLDFEQVDYWEELCRIPYGSVTTYGALARTVAARLGRASMSAQAVGGAVGHNPISILIPCHRVVGADGSLTGYAGGIDKKLWLLDHEGVETDRFFVPDNSTAP